MPTIFSRKKEESHPKPALKPVAHSTKSLQPNPSNPISLLTNYCKNPLNVQLYGQDSDENILLLLRRDFITNLPWIAKSIFFMILPLLLAPLFELANLSLDFVPARINTVILAFYYLIVFGYAFASFLTWFYTIGIITNKKAVDIDFHNLSSIHVGSVNLPDTSDAKYTQTGFLQSFFDYGDITITVEATKEKFVFEKTPRPAEVSDMLTDLIGET